MARPDTSPDTAREALADELLAIRCQLGEPDAFDALVHRWHAPLTGYARHVLGRDDRLDDVVQDIWLRVLRALPQLRDAARFRAWLFGIVRRSVMDALRRRYAEPEPVPLDETQVAATDDADDDRAEAIALMRERLGLLPAAEREVLDLFYLQSLSQAQIAEVCEIPVGTVKSRLFRARRLLRHDLHHRES